jgi:sugar phosphate isomerase/epimerase
MTGVGTDPGVTMAAMRASINQSCFPGIGTREFAACAAASGFRSVELRTLGRDEPAAALRAAVREEGLRVEAINGLMDWALPDDPDPLPALERALEAAVTVNAPLIVCAGPIRQGPLPPREIILASAADRLARMADVARPTGVRLALEQVGKSSTRHGAASGIQRLDDALTVVRRAGDEVLLTLDSYNLATAGERLEALGGIPVSKVGIAQIAGSAPGVSGRALPGEGEVDNGVFVRMLAGMGYRGAASIEIFPARPWDDPGAFAAAAFARATALLGQETRRT